MVVHAPKTFFITLADVLEAVGKVGPDRVAMNPRPGRVTEVDLLQINREGRMIYELVNGTLVAKTGGFLESAVAIEIACLLRDYLEENNLGRIAGADGHFRLSPKLVRAPDVSFVNWERLQASNIETEPYPDLVPDLAVEVLSPRNTEGELEMKLGEYFCHGVRLAWMVDPRKKQVAVHTAAEDAVILTEKDTLDGGTVLPGFTLSLKSLFTPPRPPSGKGKPKKGTK